MFACLARCGADVSALADATAASGDALAELAAEFSPRVERVHDDVMLIDVGGLSRIIGPPEEVARELARAADARRMQLAIAIASTRTAAMLLAIHEAARLASRPAAVRPSSSFMGQASAPADTDVARARARHPTQTRFDFMPAAAGADAGTDAAAATDRSRATGQSSTGGSGSGNAEPGRSRQSRSTQSGSTQGGSAQRGSTHGGTTLGGSPQNRSRPGGSGLTGTGPSASGMTKWRVSAVVVAKGDEERTLAALPIALLAQLPGDRHGAMRALPGLPGSGTSREMTAHTVAGDGVSGSSTSGSSTYASAPSAHGAQHVRERDGAGRGRGRGGSRMGDHANGAYGRTRGKRSRGSGRNYRLAPAPGEAPEAAGVLLDTLQRWGLRTLGDVLRLSGADLFERFGPASFWLQQVARGIDARPLVPSLTEEAFEAELTLEWPIDNLEPLAFVLGRLLDPLCARLERRDRGAVVVHVLLRLVTKRIEARRIELPAPMRDAKVLRTLILLDLESRPADAGIDSVTVRLDVTPGRIVQHSLLTRALPSPEQLSTLIARLTAVMGEGRVGAPALIDSHRPDAFALRRFNPSVMADPATVRGAAAGDASAPAARGGDAGEPASCLASVSGGTVTLRRFRRPLPVTVRVEGERPVHLSAARGVRGGRIVQAAGPWRSSGHWWQLTVAPELLAKGEPAVVGMATAAAVSQESMPHVPASDAPPQASSSRGSSSRGSPPPASSSQGRSAPAAPSVPASSSVPPAASAPASSERSAPAEAASGPPGAFTRAWVREEWDVLLGGGEVCRIYFDGVRRRWMLESIID